MTLLNSHSIPVDDFDLDHWGNFEPIHSMDDPSTMMEQMERRMESLRQKMGTMSNFGTPHFSGPNSSTMQTSSSRVVSSTSHSTGSDPKNMVTKTGAPTGIKNINNNNVMHMPETLLSQTSVPSGMMDFLKDAYELGDDGKVSIILTII
ncbi:unnamed protein product [Trichobilharzia regenti]|nr:unnamed protein product [Trichobilharzia regenti]